jgi:hypothetical protein
MVDAWTSRLKAFNSNAPCAEMSSNWDPQVYLARARKWLKEVEATPPGPNRDTCSELAVKYERLANLIEASYR